MEMTGRGTVLALVVGLLVLSIAGAAAGEELDIRWRWVYRPCNFQVDAQVDEYIALMERAKRAGYNGMLTGDWKWGNMEGRPEGYYANMRRAKAAADRIGIEIIPAVVGVGWSTAILQNNPNLAEGMEVKDCLLVVRDGKATVANTENLLPMGDFETLENGKLAGWSWYDSPGKVVVQDTEVVHSGRASARLSDFDAGEEHRNVRFNRTLTLKPWHQYHLRLWLKTEDLRADQTRAAVLIGQRDLIQTYLNVKPTQDWTVTDLVFNSMEHTEVGFYVGIWGARSGRAWIDDLELRETAGVNMLRRSGCPLKVMSGDGRTVYRENQDFERWEYPKMGRVPWPGGYEKWHPAPPIVLTKNSRIKEGESLKVSFYHTVVILGGQVACCLREEELFGHFERQIRNVKEYFAPRKYMLGYDELRLAGHCALCKRPGETAGQVLAEHVSRITTMIHRIDPEAECFTWSDMFDPNHNARDNFYLVASTLAGSWEGLDPSVGIVNWYYGPRDKSLPFFAERGHRLLIGGYYDSPNYKETLAGWIESARKVKGVHGVVYCTWAPGGYKDLEGFAKALDELLRK